MPKFNIDNNAIYSKSKPDNTNQHFENNIKHISEQCTAHTLPEADKYLEFIKQISRPNYIVEADNSILQRKEYIENLMKATIPECFLEQMKIIQDKMDSVSSVSRHIEEKRRNLLRGIAPWPNVDMFGREGFSPNSLFESVGVLAETSLMSAIKEQQNALKVAMGDAMPSWIVEAQTNIDSLSAHSALWENAKIRANDVLSHYKEYFDLSSNNIDFQNSTINSLQESLDVNLRSSLEELRASLQGFSSAQDSHTVDLEKLLKPFDKYLPTQDIIQYFHDAPISHKELEESASKLVQLHEEYTDDSVIKTSDTAWQRTNVIDNLYLTLFWAFLAGSFDIIVMSASDISAKCFYATCKTFFTVLMANAITRLTK